jgi:hypothetical protein
MADFAHASKKQKMHDEHDDHDGGHHHDHSHQKRLPVTMLGGFLGAGSKFRFFLFVTELQT